MIKAFLNWLLSFFQSKKEKAIHKEIKEIDEQLEDIDKDDPSDEDLLARLNK